MHSSSPGKVRTKLKNLLKPALILLTFILLFFLFTGLPLFFAVSEEGIRFTPGGVFSELAGFFRQLAAGQFDTFMVGRISYSLSEVFSECFVNSAVLALAAGSAGLIAGLTAGMLFSLYNLRGGVLVSAFLSFIPDFLLAILFQFIVIKIIRVFPGFPVTTVGYGEPVYVLPILVSCLCTGSYLAGSVYSRLRLEISQEYILYARARGISRGRLYSRHLLPALVVHLRSDLRKYVSLILANMFILERIFNIRGLSRLIFSFAYLITGNFSTSRIMQAKIVPQLNVAAAGFAGVMVLFFLVYYFLYGLLLLIRRALSHE